MRNSKKTSLFLVAILGYNIFSQKILRNLGAINTTIINPIIWIIILGLALIILPEKKIKKKKEEQVIKYSIIAGLIYVIAFLLSGLLDSYGTNPYSTTFKGFIINIWITGTIIITKEIVRYKIISSSNSKNNTTINVLVVTVFTLIDIKLFGNDTLNAQYIFKQLTSGVIPTVIKNIVFTQIVQECTFKANIYYDLIIQLMFWISPILPNTEWILKAILDIVIPIILIVYIKNEILTNKSPLQRKHIKEEPGDPKRILITGVILIPLVCFVVGIFPISPRSVATASMYPEIEIGDVVIIKKCSCNDLKIGDVIEYQIEDQYIIHRITKIEFEDERYVLTTKGDNNNAEDAKPVEEDQVIGKVIFKVKYIGLPSVKLNKILNSDKEIYVETGK